MGSDEEQIVTSMSISAPQAVIHINGKTLFTAQSDN